MLPVKLAAKVAAKGCKAVAKVGGKVCKACGKCGAKACQRCCKCTAQACKACGKCCGKACKRMMKTCNKAARGSCKRCPKRCKSGCRPCRRCGGRCKRRGKYHERLRGLCVKSGKLALLCGVCQRTKKSRKRAQPVSGARSFAFGTKGRSRGRERNPTSGSGKRTAKERRKEEECGQQKRHKEIKQDVGKPTTSSKRRHSNQSPSTNGATARNSSNNEYQSGTRTPRSQDKVKGSDYAPTHAMKKTEATERKAERTREKEKGNGSRAAAAPQKRKEEESREMERGETQQRRAAPPTKKQQKEQKTRTTRTAETKYPAGSGETWKGTGKEEITLAAPSDGTRGGKRDKYEWATKDEQGSGGVQQTQQAPAKLEQPEGGRARRPRRKSRQPRKLHTCNESPG